MGKLHSLLGWAGRANQLLSTGVITPCMWTAQGTGQWPHWLSACPPPPPGNHPPLPDAPRNVTILKNFRGGVYVIWDPVR